MSTRIPSRPFNDRYPIIDPVACAACGDRFTASGAGASVMGSVSCGHAICAACWQAIEPMSSITCPICSAVVTVPYRKNPVLTEFCELMAGLAGESSICSDSHLTTASASPESPTLNSTNGILGVDSRGAKRAKHAEGGSSVFAVAGAQYRPLSTLQAPLICEHHGLAITGLCSCVDGGVLVCGKCVSGEHKRKRGGHNVCSIHGAVGHRRLRARLSDIKTTFETTVSAWSEVLETIGGAQAQVRAQHSVCVRSTCVQRLLR